MCIISEKVNKVSSTNILVAFSLDDDHNRSHRQLTVYSNFVDTPMEFQAGNIMVLPVPFPESVEFHDLSEYAEIFDDVSFDFQYSIDHFKGIEMDEICDGIEEQIKVVDVGSYQACIIPSLDKYSLVPKDVFQPLSKEVLSFLRASYSKTQFGFILCKLRPGSYNYHPFAYSHRSFHDKFFIPTMHFHPTASRSIFSKIYEHFFGKEKIVADWDHTLYIVGADEADVNNCILSMELLPSKMPKWKTGQISLKRDLLPFPIAMPDSDTNKTFSQLALTGYFNNMDLLI